MNGEGGARIDVELLRAKRIEITGIDGSTRIELGTSEKGDAVVRLRDATGTVRAVVSIQDDMPRVRLLDRAGQVRLCTILRDDQPGVELLGSDGKPRMVMFLRAHEAEGPDIYFVDHDGDPRFGVAMDHNGHILLAAKDFSGQLKEVMWAQTVVDDESEPLY